MVYAKTTYVDCFLTKGEITIVPNGRVRIKNIEGTLKLRLFNWKNKLLLQSNEQSIINGIAKKYYISNINVADLSYIENLTEMHITFIV